MKRSTLSLVLLVSLVVVLLVIAAFTFASSASAQLGNTGVPVHCTAMAVGVNSWGYLSCFAADGTPFGNFQNVPSNRYLMVTDVQIEPSPTFPGNFTLQLWRMNGVSPQESVLFSSTGFRVEHYSTPALVVRPNERLGVNNWSTSPGTMAVEVFGLLTTSLNYLPLITR